MRRRQPAPSSSSDNSDRSDLESHSNADEVEETDSDTNPTDINTDIKGVDVADSVMEMDWSGVD